MIREELDLLLRDYPGYLRHQVDGRPGRWVIVLVSSVFEGCEEAERQADFWRYLDERNVDHAHIEYAFLFTDSEDLAAQGTAAQ